MRRGEADKPKPRLFRPSKRCRAQAKTQDRARGRLKPTVASQIAAVALRPLTHLPSGQRRSHQMQPVNPASEAQPLSWNEFWPKLSIRDRSRMTGRVQERINLRDGHTLATGSNLHDLVAGFDLSLLDDAKIEAGSAMRHSTGEPLQTSAPPVLTKSVQAGSRGTTAERRGTGVRWPHRSVFPPNKDTSISFIYECRRVSGEIAGPSRQMPPFPDTPCSACFIRSRSGILNSFS